MAHKETDRVPSRLRPKANVIDFSKPMDVVAVFIGAPATQFTVDSRVLARSKHFQAVLKEELPEGHTRTIALNDVEPEVFNAYLNWKHTGEIFVQLNLDSSFDSDEIEEQWISLLKYYLLGDRLMDINFKDVIMDSAFKYSLINRVDSPKLVNTLYANTPANATFRLLVIDLYLEYKLLVNDEYPRWFLADLCNASMSSRPSVAEMASHCGYHEHGESAYYEDSACYRKMVL